MMLIVSGTVIEIEDFLGDLMPDDSVLPDPEDPARLEDRIYKRLEEKLREKFSVLPGKSSCDQVPDRTGPITSWDKIIKPRQPEPVVSVPKVPEDPEKASDRKEVQTPVKAITIEDLTIPDFKYDKSLLKFYKPLYVAEMPDGRVVIKYFSATIYTTKEKIMALPLPIPEGFLANISPNKGVAIRRYRNYLNSVQPVRSAAAHLEDRNETEKDPDAPYKPMLKGAFSTHPGKEDYDRVGGSEA